MVVAGTLLTLSTFLYFTPRYFSLVFLPSFRYNPLVLNRAERGFYIVLEITANRRLFFLKDDKNLE